MKIPFSPPYIDDDVKAEVLAALESGWITTGPRVKALEKLVAEKIGLEYVACCNSATSSLMLVLHWFGVTKGDEVIIPAYTYAATALAVMHLGATPVMIDAAADFNIDISKVREKITSKTKAIIPVDIGGWPCDYKALSDLIDLPTVRKLFKPSGEQQKKLGRIMLLADAAHSLGAVYNDKPVGQWSDFTVFSFHAVKNITTAEGGAIGIHLPSGFNRQEVHATLKLWSLNGQTKDAYSKTMAGGWKYDIVYPGFKMNMPDICAAIGLAQLRKYDSLILPERRRVFKEYQNAFSALAWAELPPFDDSSKKSSCHLFPLRIRNISEAQRDRMMEIIASKGVSVNVHFIPLPLHTAFRERGYRMDDYPVAYDNYSREISLPVYPQLDPSMVRYVIDAVVGAYKQVIHD